MSFAYTKENLTHGEKRLQRLLEIIPGALSWLILLGMLICSVLKPVWASLVSIVFIFYWFIRLIYMTLFLVLSFSRLNLEKSTDWMAWIQTVDQLGTGAKFPQPADFPAFKEKITYHQRCKELRRLQASGNRPPLSKDIVHMVIFPVAKEPPDVIRPGVEAIASQTFPSRQILVAYALEESAPEATRIALQNLAEQLKNQFLDFLIIVHPSGLPGEARVKGANASYAATKAAEILTQRKILFENVVVSCFDADTVVNRNYFACLTYYFLVTPDRTQASFQPIPVYHNNIWNVPGFSRVMEIGSSFFQLIEATNPEQLVTFSSHSMSFQALVDLDYWPRDMISDDSAIFWKAYLHYHGRYRVVPIYVTLSMDATFANSRWQTMKNIYKQRRRWAYGVENFPILVRGFMKVSRIPLWEKLCHGFKMLEGHVSWATWGFLLTTLSWLPAIWADREFQKSVVSYNEPHITGTIFRLSTVALIISIALSMTLLPRPPVKFGWIKRLRHALEWLTIPLVMVLLSALPALDAQTRLMFGKYMEFWVTDKSRRNNA